MKLTIPAPQNIKRREAFLFAHPDYYPENRLKQELLKIAFVRAQKNLRWNKPTSNLQRATSKEFIPLPVSKKLSIFKRVVNIFKSKRGN